MLHSSQVGALTITGESSVGSGVRRLEAFVGMDALRFLARERAIVAELATLVNAQPHELTGSGSGGHGDASEGCRAGTRQGAQGCAVRGRREVGRRRQGDVGGVTFLAHHLGEAGADDVRGLVLDLRGRLGVDRPSVVVGTAVAKGRPSGRRCDQRGAEPGHQSR